MEFEKLKAIIADAMGIDEDGITPQTSFKEDLGADSLDVFQIVLGIEQEFDIEIPEDAVESIETVEDAVNAIRGAKA